MKTEKELRKKLKEVTNILNKKLREANRTANPLNYFEAGIWLHDVEILTWILGDELLKDGKKVI